MSQSQSSTHLTHDPPIHNPKRGWNGPLRLATAALIFAVALPVAAQVDTGKGRSEKEEDHFYDDRAIALATIQQDNGNVIEFLSNPSLRELILWETGPADRGGPVFADDELDRWSMLEAYLQLVPVDFPVPADLVRYSQKIGAARSEELIRGRRLVDAVPGVIDIGDHLNASAAKSHCTGIGSGPYDWGPVYRESGCNVDGKSNYLKARICNKSNWGAIRMELGYKHTCSSNSFNYPNSMRRDVSNGNYAYVAISSVTRCRRARYTYWDAFYEQATVGGWYSGSPTGNNCG